MAAGGREFFQDVRPPGHPDDTVSCAAREEPALWTASPSLRVHVVPNVLTSANQQFGKAHGGTACWLDDGRLQAIDDDALSDASSIGPPPYNEAVATRSADGPQAGSFRGAWRSAFGGPSSSALGPEYSRAQIARSAVPVAGLVPRRHRFWSKLADDDTVSAQLDFDSMSLLTGCLF